MDDTPETEHLTLIPYADKAMYMVFRGDKHLADLPFMLIARDRRATHRAYTRDEARAGVSYPGAEPGEARVEP